MFKTRKISDLPSEVSADVLFAIDLMINKYGARKSADSGHNIPRPNWIYDFDNYGNAQIAVPMHKKA